MSLIAIAAVVALLQDDTGEQFYKFPVGTAWKFLEKNDDKEKKTDVKVLKVEDGKVHMESRDFKAEGEPKVETLVWWVMDGALVWGEMKGDELRPQLRYYKCGSKKGDTWDAVAGKDGPPEAKATHMGATDVKVPAGEYKDCVHVRFEMGARTINMYWAPKVGLVKMEMSMGGEVKTTIELTEFTPAK